MSSENGSDKIYLGNCKQKQRRNGDQFLTGLICLDDIDGERLAEHIFVGDNGKRYLRIVINPYQYGVNTYGNSHSIAVDTFKPDSNRVNGGNQNRPNSNWNSNNQRSGGNGYSGNDSHHQDEVYDRNRSSRTDDYSSYNMD